MKYIEVSKKSSIAFAVEIAEWFLPLCGRSSHDGGWTDDKRVQKRNNYFPESDFSANTKTQLALIDVQLEKFRASAIMVLHSQ